MHCDSRKSAATSSARRIGWTAIAVALVAAPIYLIGLGSRAELDGHEVLVGQTARAMWRSGDWTTPRFAGALRLEKPPLAYWLAASVYSLFGTSNAYLARLPTAIAALGLVVLAFVWTARHFGQSAGLAAAFVQATSYWSIGYGKSALIDITLALCIAGAILLGWRADHRGRTAGPAIIGMWMLAALAVLAKGPVALAIVLPTVAIANFMTRDSSVSASRRLPTWASWHMLGLLAFVAIVAPWPLLILANNPEAATIWREQSVGRFAQRHGPQTRHWHFYLVGLPLLTLPWSPWWLRRGWERMRCRQHGGRNGAERLLWIWLAVGVLLLSASAGKRIHYLLPALLPCSILAGVQLRSVATAILQRWRQPTRLILATGIAAAAVTVAVDCCVRPGFLRDDALAAMIDRQRVRIDTASCVGQLGSNDRSTAFLLDRPMQWLRSVEGSFVRTLPSKLGPNDLLLATGLDALALDERCWRIVDCTKNTANAKKNWLLLEPKKTNRLADPNLRWTGEAIHSN